MGSIELILKALTAANLATPAIVAIISAIRGGVDSGQTDEQILEHASQVAQETKTITEQDMRGEP